MSAGPAPGAGAGAARVEEHFGSAEQQALLRRGRALSTLFRDDPRYSYYGRTVGLVEPEEDGVEGLSALAKAQGNSNYAAAPMQDAEAIEALLRAEGLAPMRYAKWEGGEDALSAARAVVDAFPLPPDLTLRRIDRSSPPALLAALAETALACGVLPLTGAVLRGLLQPSLCLVAVSEDGRVASCAAASAFAHPRHPRFGDEAWWGMLATEPARRGQRLALILGAHAMLEMAARFGYRRFMTGVEPGNAPSEALCARMGLAPGGFAIIGCSDPQALRGGRMTK